jgi:hypothetical protein
VSPQWVPSGQLVSLMQPATHWLRVQAPKHGRSQMRVPPSSWQSWSLMQGSTIGGQNPQLPPDEAPVAEQ